ncbi:MAG: hypothetical protein ACYDH5_12035 [Acidimicrobiales bacterium]
MEDNAHPLEVSPPERLWQLPTWLISHVAWDSYRLVVDAFGSPGGAPTTPCSPAWSSSAR